MRLCLTVYLHGTQSGKEVIWVHISTHSQSLTTLFDPHLVFLSFGYKDKERHNDSLCHPTSLLSCYSPWFLFVSESSIFPNITYLSSPWWLWWWTLIHHQQVSRSSITNLNLHLPLDRCKHSCLHCLACSISSLSRRRLLCLGWTWTYSDLD